MSSVLATTEPNADELVKKVMQCTRCKNHMPSWERYKQCHNCRQIRRQREAKAAERRRLKMMQRDDGSAMDVDSGDVRRKENIHPVQKPAAALKDLQGKEKEQALEMMKNRLKTTASAPFPPREDPTNARYKEYQSATQLYAALKTSILATPFKLQFRATHSIVASELIDNTRRAELVAKDLRKIAGLSFVHRSPVPRHSSSPNTRYLEFPCACLGYTTITPPILTNAVASDSALSKLKRQTSLKDWIQAKASSSSRPSLMVPAPDAETRVRKECGGTLLISVEDDHSHPLGFLGQRIAVRVKH